MMTNVQFKVAQGVGCALCILMWRIGPHLDGSEFSGGWLTGRLLLFYNIGIVLFAVGLFLTALLRRVGAVTSLAASILCLPLYIYFVAPGTFRSAFSKATFDVPLQTSFHWNSWAVVGILITIMAGVVGARSMASSL